jgi:hypothetical protein
VLHACLGFLGNLFAPPQLYLFLLLPLLLHSRILGGVCV